MEKVSSKEERRNAFHIMSAYRITEVGFENREAIFFRTTIEMASEYDIAEWIWVEDRDADVILVNSDLIECTSKPILNKPTRTNIRPILISCSSSGEKRDSFPYTLKKPVTYSKIITLLLKLEKELTAVAQISPPSKEKHDELNTAQQSSKALQKQTFTETGSQPETHASSTSHPVGDTQNQSDLNIDIDEDSDYDIYDLLMDSDFDSLEPEVTQTQETNSQHTSNDQSKTPKKSRSVTTYNKMDRPSRQSLEERRFLGLLRKHVLKKFKRTG